MNVIIKNIKFNYTDKKMGIHSFRGEEFYMKEIILADKAGYCFGVKRAMNMAKDELEKNNNMEIYSLGPLIHNKQAVSKYEDLGLKIVDDISDIKPSENLEVIIRSHGVSKSIYDEARRKNIDIVDTTCPFVKKIHDIVSESEKENKDIIILGDKNHPEIIGINGWCNNSAMIFKSLDEVMEHRFDTTKEYIVVSQTTMNENNFKDIIEYLNTLDIDITIKNTICSATRVRQESARDLASKVDLAIVIGGRHSSNTQKLVKICSEKVRTISIETKDELEKEDLSGYEKIGITAGASTPDWIIDDTINYLELKMRGCDQYESK